MSGQLEAFAKAAPGQVPDRRPQPGAVGQHGRPDACAACAGRASRPDAQGPGEDRHLTRQSLQYAPGCWSGVLFNPRPAASRRVRVRAEPAVLGSDNLIQGNKVRQPITARVSGEVVHASRP